MLLATVAFGQKKMIDVAACNNWERLKEVDGKTCLLNADGNYILFKKVSESLGETTILKGIKSGTEKSFQGAADEKSFDDGRMFAFKSGRDSLTIFDTEKGTYSYLTGVKLYFIIPSNKGDKIAYLTEANNKKCLIICDRSGAQIKELQNVNRYWLHKNGKGLLTIGTRGLSYVDLKTYHQNILTKDANIEDAAYSENGNEIAFILKGAKGYELRYANLRTGNTKLLLDASSDFLKETRQLEPYGLSFDNENGNIFFKITNGDYQIKQSRSVVTKDVNIWSYQDLYLQDRKIRDMKDHVAYMSMINIRTGKPIQLESDTLKLALSGNSNKYSVLTTPVNDNEFYWNKEKKRMYLLSAITGEKRLIKESASPGFEFISISPDNRFLVWFDGKDGNYYSYNIENNKVVNISRVRDNSFRLLNQRAESAGLIFYGGPQGGQYWVANGMTLIVHSKKDIWQLDPLGIKRPINLTKAYGDRYDIRFKIVEQENVPVVINGNEHLVWAFNNRSKQNGLWKINLGKAADPVKLVMSDDAYYFVPTAPIVDANTAENTTSFGPTKALKRDIYVVRKMNSSNPPNLYSTVDFKSFKQVSDIEVDKEYINVRSKLINYTLPDGQRAEGILHLPENLDESKKYPIIFNYYERRSEGLNIHRTPALSGHNINIPWYVSRGYLVFEPDFYYKMGETAGSVIDAVQSSLTELSKLPYIDTTRMGAQGQSFGGYESNVLAVQTHLFKAVCAMAGPTNIISEYGSLRPGGYNNQNSADRGQRYQGVFPWEHPEVFIKNSPNFHIGKAGTPLLLVHNKGDGAILFSQALELYLGMRRINKKVWMLEYDREDHDLQETNNKLDYTIRMQQFFDHYLKGAPAPRWMTRGISAKMKGIDSGLELDTEINTPGEGIARPVPSGKIF